MGRPLNKRFFNPVPDSNGESVSSVTMALLGDYNALATVTFSPPALPNGVTAIGATVMELLTVGINNAGADYTAGDVLVIGGGGVVGDTTAGTYSTQAVIVVDTVDGVTGEITAVKAFTVAPSNRGAYTALPAKVVGGSNVTNLSLAGGTGNNARVDITWRVKSVTVSNPGSGYISIADALPTFSAGTVTATGASVLTTTGTNVILATAFVVGGTAPLDADIIKQTSTNEYVMETTEGQSVVTLVADDTPGEGQASITATDALGETYWVMKLTSRLALLERKGGAGVYESGETAPWSLESTTLDPSGQTVQITSA